jgi:aryl-alcohol dehydrogenase
MNIRAAILRDISLSMPIETVTLEDPRPDEVLVRIVATGICHTDVKMCLVPGIVPRPIVLGHEGSGVVERVGAAVRKVAPGDHVVLTFDSCGICPTCARGMPAYCYEVRPRTFGGARMDGSSPFVCEEGHLHGKYFGQSSFATHALAYERNVVKVRRDAPLDHLGPLGCGIQTGAGAVLNTLKVTPGSSFAVFGTGAVGLSAVMAAKVAGASIIIASDVNERRLAVARELGATHVFDPRHVDVPSEILQLTGDGVDFSLDTSAMTSVMQQAVGVLKPRGTCGFLANHGPTQEVPVNALNLMLGGRTIRGLLQGDSVPDVFIPLLIDLWMDGRFPLEKLVTFYPFDAIDQAMADNDSGAAIKPILRMSEV